MIDSFKKKIEGNGKNISMLHIITFKIETIFSNGMITENCSAAAVKVVENYCISVYVIQFVCLNNSLLLPVLAQIE